jgi:hypothetical protein
MTATERLKEIEDKWTHSRMDYTDSRWLIARVHRLEEALDHIASEKLVCSNCNNTGYSSLSAHYEKIAREALEEG